ncbi:ribonuclease HI [Strigomonas culicis]|uniref:ribonuclease H n=1 Tax=Strigomonas culicis TaxID=28005 RepID=S9UHA3_9TRYP|nr:ribonuclease HI [Strigomonas culicis]|eukprot:EPY30177.1 ribonuclease HI [Strigomonas culicis]
MSTAHVNVIGAPVHLKQQRAPSPPAVELQRQVFPTATAPPPPTNHQVVYVDGACPNNGKAGAQAGYGGYYGDGDPRNFSRRLPPEEQQTNNRGEMRAVLHAIQQGFADAGAPVDFDAPRVPDAREVRRPLRPLEILSDSRYTINGLTSFYRKWVQNGFKTTAGEPVRNRDLWELLLAHRDAYNAIYARQAKQEGESGSGIVLTHVKGHSNIRGNEMADKLAGPGK